MPAARYWRVVGIRAYGGGDLELSELHLYGASGRLDGAATLASTIAPTAGTLAALQDDNLGTTCRFTGAAVRAGGFALVWDFGAGNTADGVGLRLGASADQSAFMAACTLQYSTDGAQWTLLSDFARYAWPGAGTYTIAPVVGDPEYAKVSLLLHFDGANGSTTFADNSPDPSSITAVGGAAIGTANANYGTGALSANGGRLTVPNADKLNLSIGDWTIELWFWLNNSGTQARLIDKEISNGIYPWAINYGQVTSGKIDFRSFNTGGILLSDLVGTTTVAAQQWNHVAVCRAGNTYRLFLNGVQEAIATRSDALRVSTDPVNIGNNGLNSTYGGLLIDEVRITKGVARYAANFTPPTAAFPNAAAVGGGTVFVSPTLHTADSAVQIAASAPVPAHSTNSAPRLQLARDIEFGGPGTIYGTTKTKGTPNQPTHARVVLLHQRSKLPVRETWSDPVTGNFAFTGIDTTQQFLTLAEDAAGNFRPVAANRLAPEVLP